MSESDLTIEGAKAMKSRLEYDIEQKIKKFQEETGLRVTMVDIDEIDMTSYSIKEIKVHVNVIAEL